MKNYKHSVKSNNAMKLAAVASAAIMMAPVALNTVSTFATSDKTQDVLEHKASDGQTYREKLSALKDAATAELAALKGSNAKDATVNGVKLADTLTWDISKLSSSLHAQVATVGSKTDFTQGVSMLEYVDMNGGIQGDINAAKAAVTKATPASLTNYNTLTAAIAKAKNLYGLNVKTNATTAAAAGFAAQIKGAELIAKSGTANDATVTAATADLNAAAAKFATSVATEGSQNDTNDFNNAQNATTTAVKSAQASVASAQANYAKLSDSAKNSKAGAAYRAAIDTASNKLRNGEVKTSADATKIAGDLTSAYNAAVAAGVAADTATAKSALAKAIDSAKTSESALASYKGTNAASVAAFNNFDGVVKAAQAVYENPNATAAALNAAAANVAATLGDTLAKNGNDFNNFKAAQNAILALKNLKQKIASTQTGVAHINYAKGYGIQIWTKDHKLVMTDATHAKKAMGGKNYKVFGSVTYINGKKFYNVGGNQYIDAAYVTFTATK